MWLVAGVLLGLVVLVALAGFHAGPHAHVLAAALGILAAAWLVVMAALGDGRTLLWVLLGADLTVSGALGTAGLAALRRDRVAAPSGPSGSGASLEGAMGVALSRLAPLGVVRVAGEEWSAEAVNGTVPAGGAVQVLEVQGLRLRVWGEQVEPAAGEGET
ncbi:NfeD family protein [Aciditerrimonas ferrireducens]|uniref:NfeD family protein n=1 Tax=Aciditerrimonas ferrireducens TaxID=667306 RepID=UPI002003E844|nr:NfeD family protein [Aciditerrimonas ferrireducens]MCK4176473.1 NfeD family protein [Aciditerrimonas ferrireducens]